MASRIKGITVEIGGDTSGLEKSLAAVNNSIKKTQPDTDTHAGDGGILRFSGNFRMK